MSDGDLFSSIEEVKTKVCPRCKNVKSVIEFGNHCGGKLQSYCKSCQREYGREWNKKAYRKVGEGPPRSKKCRSCKIIKPHTDFYRTFNCESRDLLKASCIECLDFIRAAQEAGMKWCPCCREQKHKDDFYKMGIRPNGQCKKCNNDRTRKIWLSLPEKVRYEKGRARTLRMYGLTLESFDEIRKSQNNSCAICGSSIADRMSKNLCIDHDHQTGEVRGLLCRRCNSGIGQFDDDLEKVKSAVRYLEKHLNKGNKNAVAK